MGNAYSHTNELHMLLSFYYICRYTMNILGKICLNLTFIILSC